MPRSLDITPDGKLTWAKKARGRTQPKRGAMNKTESRYAQHLDLLQKAGEVLWWKFEGVTLKLGPDLRLTPDFAVMLPDGTLALDDTKGATKSKPRKDGTRKDKPRIEDDSRAKIIAASEMFPFVFRVVYMPKGSNWVVEEVGR